MRINGDVAKELFQTAIFEIVNHVQEQLQRLQSPIDTIVLVGGFAEFPMLQDAIKKNFEKDRLIIVPPECGLAVPKGALLFGHDPSNIASRRSRYTFGVAMTIPFNLFQE